MSDQDTKPAEGDKTPVENLETDVIDSNTTPDVPQTNGEAESDTKMENEEAAKGSDKDHKDDDNDAVQDVAQDVAQDTVMDNNEEATSLAEVFTNTNSEDKESEANPKKRKWPSIRYPPAGMLKVNRGGCPTREKSDPSILPDSDDPKAIRWQVEFYFSDSNLPSDKFLWKKTDGSNNKPVPLSLICSFSRMRRFKPYSAVVEALKTSSRLVLEGPDGEETIRRKEPCQPSNKLSRQIEERTTYIKGFGEENKSTQFDAEDFVSQFGEINAVRLRRDENHKDRVFKGSIFVEWVDEETANKFYDLKPEPRYKDHPMMIMPKREYDRQSAEEEIRKKRSRPDGHNEQRRNGHRGGKASHGHQGYDPDHWKKRREHDQREGFNDRRGHRGRGRGGGRGRGRGGNRNQNSSDRTNEQDAVPHDDGRPKIHTSKSGQKILEAELRRRLADGKRDRDEEDSTIDAPPAKKVDTKEAVADVA
ncbi:hypothetical protein F4805DRAFT_422692 [Annulohypoxylon moriforme]|nr:hypothetical protein F4805DRAFT_422692 [Annulohypoxylon moriforme]